MNLNQFAKEIHENAVAHGWWDEPRPFDELCALMISELAEALEEARAGRPMEWYWKDLGGIDGHAFGTGKVQKGHKDGCKPEGIAVEMADCAIRILDYLGSVDFNVERNVNEWMEIAPGFSDLAETYMEVADRIIRAREFTKRGSAINICRAYDMLAHAITIIIGWFCLNLLDFEAIARRKHEYNKTRAYKHGKEF